MEEEEEVPDVQDTRGERRNDGGKGREEMEDERVNWVFIRKKKKIVRNFTFVKIF